VILFLGRLVRVLAVLLLARVVLRGFAAWRRRAVVPAQPRSQEGNLVRDRVCNTFLPMDRALRAAVDGREEYFCSPACRDRAGLDSGQTPVQSQGFR
jgi:hypothetical protein